MADSRRPAAITFVIPGQRLATRSGTAASTDQLLPGQVKDAVRLGTLRAGGEPVRVQAVPGEDVVVLQIADGPELLLHPESARDLMLGQSSTTRSARAGAEQATEVPSEVPVVAELRWQGLEQAAPTRTRGFLGKVLLSSFKVLTGLSKTAAAKATASVVVQQLDAQVEAGLYRLSPESLQPLKGSGLKIDQPLPAHNEPLLVLVHGTFVETVSTFGKLWTFHRERVQALFSAYGQRVYALDHPTLGASPIANAQTLVDALPAGARLHLATHSRGGLVAEVLVRVAGQRGELNADDLAFFDSAAYRPQRAELQALAAAVKAKRISVERVVRVACPARGTLLASKRLDAYLSVLRWSLQAVGLNVVPALVDFLAEVARRRADPGQIPGLAAMMPDAPLVAWLNSPQDEVPGDLRVVAGDIQGDSVTSWVKTLLADAYYWTDNDIVVQTRSMYAGTPRQGGASFLLDRGGRVNHFRYFENETTARALVEALTLPQPAGFQEIGPQSARGDSSTGLRAQRVARSASEAAARPAVFVLPGILGSNLKVGDKRIWLGLRLLGGLKRLAYQPGDEQVQPDGPVSLIYDDLARHLAATHEVHEFAFDWRRPIEQEARRLAAAVDRELQLRRASGQPVRLLAHSMGGLVARVMQLEQPAVFERLMQRPGARILMLGTPNGGSWAPMQVLSGDDTFGNTLAALGSPFMDHRARQLMAEMPGFLQLQDGLLNPQLALDRHATWRELADRDLATVQQANWWHHYAGETLLSAYEWGVPTQTVLDQAKALRERLDAQRQPGSAWQAHASKVLLVVGRASFTPCGYEWTDRGLVYLNTPDGGDGRVTLASAQLPGVQTWTLDAEHGSLPDVKRAFDAYVELLAQGDTARLPLLGAPAGAQRSAAGAAAATAPAALVRSRPSRSGQPPRMALDEREVFLVAAPPAPEQPSDQMPPLQVRVLNGNLSFVRNTLMVGHQRSLSLTGSEAVVNRLVGGQMQDSLDAGLYPDGIGSHQIFRNAKANAENPWRAPQPAMVVVVGLGEEGKLKEGELTRSVRQAVIAWVQRLAETGDVTPAAGLSAGEVELNATLMGSGGTSISASDAARAIAAGVREANRRLSTVNQRPWPRVTRLVLVELYLERASDAWNGLKVLAESAPGQYEVEDEIASGIGPLRRQMDSGYRGTDYDLVAALGGDKDVIHYRIGTRRARTEVRAQSTQGALRSALIKRASNDANRDPQLGRTLFHLLVPLEVEPFLGGSSRMLLELDQRTAAIPWELLDGRPEDGDGTRSEEPPWAIRTRLLRKLQQTEYRQQVQDARATDAVLVIGEPLIDDPNGEFVPLPAARHEALAVHRALIERGGLGAERVELLADHNDAATIINRLFARRYRMVHIAGHGVAVEYDERNEVVVQGGVVLSENTVLGPDEIRAMRTVPELVFVNCCHLGQMGPTGAEAAPRKSSDKTLFSRAEFAMGVANELIAIGVRCVIAAGWAVEDEPAQLFAETFYREILARRPFIDAVATARRATWERYRDSNTWAAYQAYGDPNWTYRRGPKDPVFGSSEEGDEFDGIASALGLALALEEQAVRSRWMNANPAVQCAKVGELERRFAPRWGHMGAVAEAFGLAYADAGAADLAIAWYERAVAAADASASMRAQEQLGNLRVRQAWARLGKPPVAAAAVQAARAEIERARDALRGLAAMLPTVERHSLCGSAHKRLAMLHHQHGRRADVLAALKAAIADYTQAERLAEAAASSELHYPVTNRVTLQVVLALAEGRKTFHPAPDDLARLNKALQDKAQNDPDFWAYAGLIELDLLQALAAHTLADQQPDLARRFLELHRRVNALGKWRSVADNASLLLDVYGTVADGAQRSAAQALLQQLQGYAGLG